MRKIYQLNSELFKITGIQRVLMDIHEALTDFDSKIVGNIPYDKVNQDLHIEENDYLELKGYSMFRNSTVIIHERKYLPVFWFLNNVLRYNVKLVYIHHNELYGQKLLSRFPKNVIAISDAGIGNLCDYFKIPKKNITKIHNCVRQPIGFTYTHKAFNPDDISILYPARINSVKRQIEIVHNLKGKLDNRIKIYFAGIGPDYEALVNECEGSEQFIPLGYRDNVPELLQQADFMMLFSKHEGLPISLIEATMTGTPIICNNVGGNCEIAENGKNAFVVNKWDDLVSCLNNLANLDNQKWLEMSKAGREIYQTKFGFDKFKLNYQKLIKSLSEE